MHAHEGRISSSAGCPAGSAGTFAVQQLLFVAVHADDDITEVDKRLVRHYTRELEPIATVARLVLMMYRPPHAADPSSLRHEQWRTEMDGPTCVWRRRDVFHTFPRLRRSIRQSDVMRKYIKYGEPQYIQDYFWFHASLLVWYGWHGQAFPAVRYFWRLEADVLYSGSLRALLTWQDTSDVVLPGLRTEAAMPANFGPFHRDPRLLASVAPEHRLWGLVAVGRYSLSFLRLMERKWSAGVIGYEEVLLPTACANATRDGSCTLLTLSPTYHYYGRHSVGGGSRRNAGPGASHVRFRPEWSCDAFVAARHRGVPEFWHPVKRRECYANYLDGNESALQRARLWRNPPPSPPPPWTAPSPPEPPPPPPGTAFERHVFSKQAFSFTDRAQPLQVHRPRHRVRPDDAMIRSRDRGRHARVGGEHRRLD